MKKNIKTIVFLAIIVIAAYFYAHIDKKSYLYDRRQDAGEYISTGILADEEIVQTFICSEKTLDGIEIKSTVSGDVTGVTVTYRLVDDKTGTMLEEGQILGTEFDNGKFHRIDLDDMEDVEGKDISLVISEAGSDEVNGIGFSIGSQNLEISKALEVKGNSTSGALVARTYCHRFDLKTFVISLAFVAYIVGFMKVLYKLFK